LEKDIHEVLQEASGNDAREIDFDRKKALKLYSEGMTDGEIALELGVRQLHVAMWRKECGFQEHSHKAEATAEDKPTGKWDRAKELYDQGLTDGRIAEAIGVSTNSVLNWRRKEGLPSNYDPKAPRKQSSEPPPGTGHLRAD
jgi:uncharacterized protein YjcR